MRLPRVIISVALLTIASVIAVSYVICARDKAQLLRPQVVQCTGSMWLFDSGTRHNFGASSQEAQTISNWIASHQTGWRFSSLAFDPSKTQFVCETYGIELVSDLLVLDYRRRKTDDPDSSVHIERSLLAEEQGFWKDLISRIKTTNPHGGANGRQLFGSDVILASAAAASGR